MKAMKAMKAMKKAKKVTIVGRKAAVFAGRKTKTVGGLKKSDLKKNANGKIVSIKASNRGKKTFQKNLKGWTTAVSKARKELKIKGFCAVKKGTPLYNKAKQYYKK